MMLKSENTDLKPLIDFLRVETPKSWLEQTRLNIPLLLVDHAHCERKAAATAIHMISKYPEKIELVELMSPLAREELLHFEKVIGIIQKRNISFKPLHPSNYALSMHQLVTQRDGINRLCDQLIVGAIIEARSCERFAALIEYLDDLELKKLYSGLVKSEARHFKNYLDLVQLYGGKTALNNVHKFLDQENAYIISPDLVFRFHSGIPS